MNGSVLGPLLILLFINLPGSAKSSINFFTDDVKLIGNATRPDSIQTDLDFLIGSV